MKKTFIIAEAGVNHNGNMELAKKLIDVAVEAGADAVKFQTWKTELCITKDAKKADYQIENTKNSEETQFEMVKKLELSFDDFYELADYCKKKSIIFLSTPFDIPSIELLHDIGVSIFKIPSGEITNLPYLEKIASYNKGIILSTGMSTLSDIEKALEIIIRGGTQKEKISILHANSEYPTPMEDVNLNAMITIGNCFKLPFGYSDHTKGIEVDIAAVAMGASVIEKHFTLNNNLEGPDHQASLEPDELKNMVKSIRNIELALGDGIKRVTKSEAANRLLGRKSIVAKRSIKKGEVFTNENLIIKRPGTGLSPMLWYKIIGQSASKDFEIDDFIRMD